MPDSEAVDRGLEAFLRQDSALGALIGGTGNNARVFMGALAQGTIGPAVVWMVQGGLDNRTHDRRGYEATVYEVKGVGQSTSATQVVQVSQRLRQLLEGASFDVDGYEVIRCERVGRIAYPELDGDLRWHHRGALWEVFAAPRR